MLFDRTDALDQVIDLFGKAGNVLHGQFESVDALANVFEFGADIGEARAHLGEPGLRFLTVLGYLRLDADNLGLVIGDVAGKGGESPLDQRFKSVKTFVIGLWHAHSISL